MNRTACLSVTAVLAFVTTAAVAAETKEQRPVWRPQDAPLQPLAPPEPTTFRPLSLPEPKRFEVMRRWATEDVSHYTGRTPIRVGPGLRVAPGVSGRVTGDQGLSFTLDVLTGARIGLHPGDTQWVLVPEAGYTLRAPDSEHLLSVGLGVGRGQGDSRPWYDAMTVFGGLSYVPRLVVAPFSKAKGVGFRQGVIWDHAETTLGLELSHQYLYADGLHHNDLRLTASIDLALAAILLLGNL